MRVPMEFRGVPSRLVTAVRATFLQQVTCRIRCRGLDNRVTVVPIRLDRLSRRRWLMGGESVTGRKARSWVMEPRVMACDCN